MEFWDTNEIIRNYKDINDSIYISSISLLELEHIKTSKNKDEETKYAARKAVHAIEANNPKVVIYNKCDYDILVSKGLDESPDNKIIATAYRFSPDVVFVTNDLCCRLIAQEIFGLTVRNTYNDSVEEYKGFKEICLSENDMAYFYEHPTDNQYGLLPNEYLILKDESGEIVDQLKWDGYSFTPTKVGNLKSDYFGNLKPYKGDPFQICALNSLLTNQVTMLKGKAGTGKSYLALGYLFYLLEKHKIDRIIVFCNTVATANSAKLGYYPGSRLEKLLDSSIGNMLSAKLGGDYAMERLTGEGKIVLLPMSDIRGYDTTNMKAGVYITEAQNMDISLMKLALQRIGEDSICIIDGDYTAQVDLSQYAGNNNGMRRMSEVFRGQDFYGEIELQNIYRSRIAKIAESM